MPGIITEDDRKLLKGEKAEASERAREQQRIRLRRRVRESINDFPFLLNHLSKDDYKAIFQPERENEGAIIHSTIATLGFLHYGIDHTEHSFDELVQRAKKQSKFRENETVELTGECPSCHSKLGFKLSRPTDAALFSGSEAICNNCGETAELTPDN